MRSIVVVACCATLGLSACGRESRPAGEGPYAREIADAIPKIERTVGLSFKTPPKVEARSKQQVRAFLEKKFNEDLPAAQIEGEQTALRRLGLIPDSMDLRAFMLDLYTEQIAGYYDPATKVLYVVEGSDSTVAGITVTHELVHALQDQYVNLDSLQHLKNDSDREAAAQAVIEGQATYEQMEIMVGGSIAAKIPGGWDEVRRLIRQQSAQMPIFSRAPLVIQESAVFPYLSGAEFVRRLKEASPKAQPFDRMPTSTEQVMHPVAYESTPPDAPTSVTLPAPRGATSSYDDVMGEFATRIFLFEHLRDQNAAVRGAAGWDGDRYVVLKTSSGDGLAWLSVWDTPLDAGEFGDLAKQTLNRHYGAGLGTAIPNGTEFHAAGRTLRVTGGELQGRPYVLYVDVPAGANPDVIDLSRVTLRQ
jgi:hypothetical protein